MSRPQAAIAGIGESRVGRVAEHEANAVGDAFFDAAGTPALDDKLSERIQALDERVNERIQTLDDKFAERFLTLDEKFSERLHDLDEKFSDRIQALDDKFTERFEGTVHRIEALVFKSINKHMTFSVMAMAAISGMFTWLAP